MRVSWLAGLVAGLVLSGPGTAARAAVTYDFSTAGTTFRYVSPDFVTTARTVLAADLASHSGNVDQVDFLPACPDAGFGACDELSTDNFTDRSVSPFYFPDGAFGADGIYPRAFGLFPATLTVSGTPDPAPVPEPASLALLASGLAGIAAARRRRA